MNDDVAAMLALIQQHDGINNKSQLSKLVAERFSLTRDRSVFYCRKFALRFSASNTQNFSNTVLSLSNLQKVDDRPFIVCLVTPTRNYAFLANTTFLKKVSHSSQQLRENNIRGSFNGSDIMRDFNGIANEPMNFGRLFAIHTEIGFEGNLVRLVEATNNISPTGVKFQPSAEQIDNILEAPNRAVRFVASDYALDLKAQLDRQVDQYKNEILLAGLIENVNVRGRVIEYLIAGEDDGLREKIVDALTARSSSIPQFRTENALGDYTRAYANFVTATDVKTKIMVLDSNPKAYNLDKVLEFLAAQESVFLFYFVGINPTKIVNSVLISMFQKELLSSTVLLRHWSGRNSRGVSQFEGKTVGKLIASPSNEISVPQSVEFLQSLIAL